MSTDLLAVLYQKATEFESKLTAETKEKLQCQKGCSQCCYIDLSVFQIEAQAILDWFEQLSLSQKEQRLKLLEIPLKEGACIFLRNEECTIYEARPLICRTQGLPLHFKNEFQETTLDICPLNDEAIPKLLSHEILNLDLVNNVLSQLEAQASQGKLRPRVLLRDLFDEMKARTL